MSSSLLSTDADTLAAAAPAPDPGLAYRAGVVYALHDMLEAGAGLPSLGRQRGEEAAKTLRGIFSGLELWRAHDPAGLAELRLKYGLETAADGMGDAIATELHALRRFFDPRDRAPLPPAERPQAPRRDGCKPAAPILEAIRNLTDKSAFAAACRAEAPDHWRGRAFRDAVALLGIRPGGSDDVIAEVRRQASAKLRRMAEVAGKNVATLIKNLMEEVACFAAEEPEKSAWVLREHFDWVSKAEGPHVGSAIVAPAAFLGEHHPCAGIKPYTDAASRPILVLGTPGVRLTSRGELWHVSDVAEATDRANAIREADEKNRHREEEGRRALERERELLSPDHTARVQRERVGELEQEVRDLKARRDAELADLRGEIETLRRLVEAKTAKEKK